MGGISKLISDHETRLLVEPQNTDALNQAIHRVLAHLPNARHGLPARGLVARNVSLDRAIDRTVSVSGEIL